MTNQTTTDDSILQSHARVTHGTERRITQGAKIRIAAIALCAVFWAGVLYWAFA